MGMTMVMASKKARVFDKFDKGKSGVKAVVVFEEMLDWPVMKLHEVNGQITQDVRRVTEMPFAVIASVLNQLMYLLQQIITQKNHDSNQTLIHICQ